MTFGRRRVELPASPRRKTHGRTGRSRHRRALGSESKALNFSGGSLERAVGRQLLLLWFHLAVRATLLR